MEQIFIIIHSRT